jgi:glycosyltransferase involved in cell wall biosynthesis
MHIAVILPEAYRGGTLRGALNIVKMLFIGSRAAGDFPKISFGYVGGTDVYLESDFYEIKKMGVQVRPFRTIKAAAVDVEMLSGLVDSSVKNSTSQEYLIFNDTVSNFEDADIWLIVSDRLSACIPPHIKYALVVYDYIQRYVPEIFGCTSNTDANWKLFEKYAEVTRKADFVICTTKQTQRDCITYTGSQADRVALFPMEFDPMDVTNYSVSDGEKCTSGSEYILWTTNSTQHKNHKNIINGLEIYFGQNKDSVLEVHMTGVYTHLFSDDGIDDSNFTNPYIESIRRLIAKSPNFRERLIILGNVSDEQYLQKLTDASWLLHGALYDNGTFSIYEAAWVGVPSICSMYPAIREQCNHIELDVVEFDPYSPLDLSEKLTECLSNRQKWIKSLPDRVRMSKITYENIAPEYWSNFKERAQSAGIKS